MHTEFGATWGRALVAMSIIATIILIVIPFAGMSTIPNGDFIGKMFLLVLPPVILISALMFVIRGYVLTDDSLHIKRLFWNTKINLSTLKSAGLNPVLVKKSMRTFGNGGLFSFTGRYWNKQLGHFRMFVTNFDHSVVLKFMDRVIVVSPDEPAMFVAKMNMYLKK
ncbi:hypothetical protein JW960_20880 [candidate division KSB1 bacterium]|nr:hypothetical protein [candidate division KSB1 bacterium]